MPDDIQFGTDGWRGVIGDGFIFANVRRVAEAAARYVCAKGEAERGLVVGYDTRFLSPESARVAAEAIASAGIPVILADRPTPTPAISFAVVAHRTAGAIVVTASHNPYRWNGIKFKASYGGSAAPGIVQEIENHLADSDQVWTSKIPRKAARIDTLDLISPYLQRLKALVNLERIRSSGLRFAIDPMYGAARGLISQLFTEAGIPCLEIHGEHNPLFPGLNPEPIEPHVEELRRAIVQNRCHAGLATDGDADRVGAVDMSGAMIDSHKIFSILLRHLVEDLGRRGEVVRTFSTTKMIDKIAQKYGLPLHVTPIGFKYICELMLTRDILIGGEESGGIGIKGHLPERDGILNSLLLAEVMAEKGKTLGELVEELNQEFGPHYYGRVDLEVERPAINRTLRLVEERRITEIAGRRVSAVEDLDGFKMLLGDSAWLMVRASGTENLLRIYAEAPSPDEVRKMLDEITDRIHMQANSNQS